MAPLSLPLEPTLAEMKLSELAAHCMREINNYRQGEAYDDRYCLEIFRRALIQRDHAAWELIQNRFSETVRNWMR